MYGISPGNQDGAFAVSQARMRAGMPPDDPAEEHMQRLLSTSGLWLAVVATVSGAALWFWGDVAAIGVAVVVTLGALALARMVARRQRARSSVG